MHVTTISLMLKTVIWWSERKKQNFAGKHKFTHTIKVSIFSGELYSPHSFCEWKRLTYFTRELLSETTDDKAVQLTAHLAATYLLGRICKSNKWYITYVITLLISICRQFRPVSILAFLSLWDHETCNLSRLSIYFVKMWSRWIGSYHSHHSLIGVIMGVITPVTLFQRCDQGERCNPWSHCNHKIFLLG